MRRLWISTLGCVTLGLLLLQAPVLTREASSNSTSRGQRDVVFGVVRDAEDNEPIAGATILAEQVGGDRHSVLTDEEGHYGLKNVPLGDYVLTAFAADFAVEVHADTIRIDGLTPCRVDFRLERRKSGGLYGWVRFTEDSLPIASASVRLISDSTWETYSTTTDSNGAYIFDQVPVGSYTLLTSGAGWGAVPWDKSILITSDTLLGAYDFFLPRSGHVNGISGAVSVGPNALPDADVFALTDDPVCELIIANSDANGQFNLSTNLVEYAHVWARHDAYSVTWRGTGARWDPSQRVNVAGSTAEFQLKPRATGPWGISGVISGPSGPLCLGFVTATDTGGSTVDVSPIWPNGRYALGQLPSGGYSLRVVVPGKIASEIGYVRLAQASVNDVNYDIGQSSVALEN